MLKAGLKRLLMPRLLSIFLLLLCLPCTAATVYKSVDARGRVTFSDAPPSQAVTVEELVVNVQAAASPELYLARMVAMTEVTDKIAAARKEREKSRQASRQHETNNIYPADPGLQQRYYSGYSGYSRAVNRRYRKRGHPAHLPAHPIAYPPLQPLRGPALVNQYPASLVRRSYSPHVAAVFQSSPTVVHASRP